MTIAGTKLETDLPLKYLAHVPGSTLLSAKNKPLIIFLHGYGSNESDLFYLKNDFIPDITYLSVRAPLPLYAGSYQWFNLQTGNLTQIEKEIKNSVNLLKEFIAASAKKYQTTNDKIILIGFSQGAVMSYEIALRDPKAVRGIIALSGPILPSLLTQMTPGLDLGKLAVFIGHGAQDNRIPLAAATAAYEALKKTSIKPEFHSYEGLGHSINHAELKDIKNWLIQTLSTAS